jgi:hypothetical protein
MDRNIVYAGSIPLDSDILSLNRNVMVSLGYIMRALMGVDTCADGLDCLPTTPASMSITVGPGSITSLTAIDVSSYGSLPADLASPLLKMGIITTPTRFTLTAPSTSGQSINYLIQATFQEADTDPVVLPYYNAANPDLSNSGPGNSGAAQNTLRTQRVSLQVKTGLPGPGGSQATPAVDDGWVGLYFVSVAYGQTAVDLSSIHILPTAPFIYWKALRMRPGFGSGTQTFRSSGSFSVPAGVTQLEVEVWGGGAGSYASVSGLPSGGGSGGGYARKRIAGVYPGQSIEVVVGLGGAGGTVAGSPATTGNSSRFGNLVSATGGSVNYLASTTAPQNGATPPGVGIGGDVNLTGSAGQAGAINQGGMGGASPMGGTQNSGTTGNVGIFPGGGGSGAGTGANGLTPYDGAAGASGLVAIRW